MAKNVQDQCINSVRVLIKASYQTVLNCLLLDHFLSSINFPSEQALKLGFDLMAPFWTHLKKISFIFYFQITILFLSSSPPFEFFFFFFFFSMYNACNFAKNSNVDIANSFFNFCLCKFVTPFFGILRSFGVFILAKCGDSFHKFNKYFRINISIWATAHLPLP